MRASKPTALPGTASRLRNGVGRSLQKRARRAFTLVEVMIATMVFTMGILGVYAMMLKSYELVTLSRHRDNGRAVLLSFADQFLRLQTTDYVSGVGNVTRGLFVPHAPTSLGLSWTDTAGNTENGTLQADPTLGLRVLLGDSGNALVGSQIEARVWREVTLIDPSTGAPVGGSVPTATAAGYLMQATFTISYPIAGRVQRQSLIVARSAR